MRRRDFVLLVGGAVLTSPLVSLAQPATKPARIGWLGGGAPPGESPAQAVYTEAFKKGLRDLGYVEGRNLIIEWRFAEGRFERLDGFAREFVALGIDVIVTGSTPATLAAKKATASIPIVMMSVSDPVATGLVKSLARPGENITGLANLTSDLSPKHLETLRSITPGLSRVAVLVNPGNQSHRFILTSIAAAAQRTNVAVVAVEARTADEIDNAFSMLIKQNCRAVIVAYDPSFVAQEHQIARLAVKHRIASIGGNREFAEAGGLVSYGYVPAESFRRAASYVDKILKGAKPGDLPVEQPTKFELIINLKTAKALGMTVPQTILIRADRVIE